MSKWKEIHNDNFDEFEECYKIDAWETIDDNEEGMVIAKVYIDGNKGTVYIDKDAETDEYAQEMIDNIIMYLEGSSNMNNKTNYSFRKLTEEEFLNLKEGTEIYVKIGNGYYKSHVLSDTHWNSDCDEPCMEVETTNGFCDNYSVYTKDISVYTQKSIEQDFDLKKYLNEVDNVCLACTQDTLNDDNVCNNCPVRKSVDFYTNTKTKEKEDTTEKEYLYSALAYDHNKLFDNQKFTCDETFEFSTIFINDFLNSEEYEEDMSLLQAFYDYQEKYLYSSFTKYLKDHENKLTKNN